MSRKLKFKAWHRLEKKMVRFLDLTENFFVSTEKVEHASDYFILQFTGMLDCNNVEVYDGDIVRVTSRVDEMTGVIVWANEAWNFKIKVDSPYDCPFRMLNGWRKVEVKGNIYENKELSEGIENEKN